MEVCQFCEMYMQPFVDREKGEATCEFCGEVIAYRIEKHWQKTLFITEKKND